MERIVCFEQLQAWQEAHKLVLMVYQTTKAFPGEEKFGLVSQMRRAAVPVPANEDCAAQSETVGRLLNGLMVSTERRK